MERYFRLQGVLPSVAYWWGGERPSPSDPFELSDGTSVPQVGGGLAWALCTMCAADPAALLCGTT